MELLHVYVSKVVFGEPDHVDDRPQSEMTSPVSALLL